MKNLLFYLPMVFVAGLLGASATAAECIWVSQENFELIQNQTTKENPQEIIASELEKFSKEQQTRLLALAFSNQKWTYSKLLILNHVRMNDQLVHNLRKQYGVETAIFYQKMEETAIKEQKKRQRECRNCLTATASSGTGSLFGILAASSCTLM